ncbi:MAG: HlyD family efflux transporter periplasmic adaptor subunit [Nitrospira sp.]|nr:HlyD family efflux transporter periplasmic adaptor subunit [Nitrospira sp.]
MVFGPLGRQWSVWKVAWQAESGQPPNRAVPEGPAVEFLPEALDIQEAPPSPIGRALLWTILIAFATGAICTTLVRIDSVTMAHGKVVSSGDAMPIHLSETGVVTAIHVQEGQAVTQGNVLIELDSTRKLAETEPQSHTLVSEFQRPAQAEHSVLETKAASPAQEATQAEQKAGLQRVRSPIDGVVQRLAVQAVGTVVTPAHPVLTVVPLSRLVEVEAQVESKEVGVVHKGQPVEIKIVTFQSVYHGSIPGHVLRGPDNKTLNAQVGLVSSIRVGLDRSTIQVGSTEVKLLPGMAVAAEIKTGQRRMIEHLVDPVLDSAKERVRDWNTLVDAVRGFLTRRNLL